MTSATGSTPSLLSRDISATYRLQLHRDFTFADAADQVPYLADLGISTLYLSPVLQAVAGSQHGYDVVSHREVNSELGGEAGLRQLATTAHAHGLSVMVDVVPNHMALAPPEYASKAVWALLREGPAAPTAHWFDVDWQAGGDRVILPVLGGELEEEISAGALVLDTHDGEPVIRYHDHVLPVAPGTEEGEVDEVLERQHYRLVSWREDETLNYRRFFAVSSLIAVRVELPDVFRQTHRLLLKLNHAGVIDAFRIDHPDGLADPEEYLRMLHQSARGGTRIYVEKILQGDEELPGDWKCEGTTGYETARVIAHALGNPVNEPLLDRTWLATGGVPSLEEAVDTAKRYVVREVLRPELARLTRRATAALETTEAGVEEAVEELLVASRVYRAYYDRATADVSAYRRTVLDAVARAVERRPDLADHLERLGSLVIRPEGWDAYDFSVRLQQVWSAVVAKSVEDTAFYRWNRLIALNEVGGEPAAPLGAIEHMHEWAAQRLSHWPEALNALSTHDTKRSEDVRARLLAVAADAESWTACSAEFARAADDVGLDRPTAHLVWQTLIGAGEIEPERVDAALVKAVREAALHTSWTDPVQAYEELVVGLARQAQELGQLNSVLHRAVSRNEDRIRALVLGQKALQLLLPGVPDIYQGTELVDLSLVDPDNRRPVDFDARRETLTRLADEEPKTLDEEKLLLTSRLLRLRQELPEVFGSHGRYAPLPCPEGARDGAAPSVLGFVRGERVACLVTTAAHEGGWLTQRVRLPDGLWRDRLSGHVISSAPAVVPCEELFAQLPVAVLVRDA